MADGGLVRTEHWNVNTGTPRSGAVGHGEAVTDIERYLLPLLAAEATNRHSWGVAGGLAVLGTPGSPGVTVQTGVAMDSFGRFAVLAVGGAAIVDPTVDPAGVSNIPTVPVPANGLTLPTVGSAGDQLVTLTFREVLVPQDQVANAPVLLHAPWLRLLPVAGFADDGQNVVLARVSVDGSGNVTALTPGSRRPVGDVAGRIQLRAVRQQASGVDDAVAAEWGALAGGGAGLTVAGTPALTVDATGHGRLANGLTVAAPNSSEWSLTVDAQNRLGVGTAGIQGGAVVVDTGGQVGVGLGGGPIRRSLQVEGTEIHSGGWAGGFSFADRAVGGFVDGPSLAAERWVWYAANGSARLWSGRDVLSIDKTTGGGGLDVYRRMRVRADTSDEAKAGNVQDQSAGIWFFQNGGDRGFVGMRDDRHIGLYGANGAGWGLFMDTATGELSASGRPTAITAQGGDGLFNAGVHGLGNFGVWAEGSNNGIVASGPNFAGVFWGNVQITGSLDVRGEISKGGGGFRIDHPDDPARKFLAHSFVESPERRNLYAGRVTTDGDGRATVELPSYFSSLNTDASIQVTPIGVLTTAAVMNGLTDNAFTVATGEPNVLVDWLVTGVRQDAWARANPLSVEAEKSTDERDRYLHPEPAGQPAESALAGPASAEFRRPTVRP